MEWKNETPKPPKSKAVIDAGLIRLTVSESVDGPERWQFFSLDFGDLSEASHEECLRTWPREAIARARKALDEFEANLNKGESE